jgi:DNA-binding beta-propeller fold protein YncE
MRVSSQVQILSALAALALLAACSGGGSSALAPSITSLSPSMHSGQGRPTIRRRSFYNCPSTGRLTYISIWNANAVDVFAGKLNNQNACGEIVLGLSGPLGLYVDEKTHDLYVANSKRSNIKVFHRGHVRAYNTYVDPTDELTIDVAVAPDGTVIASNQFVFDGSGAGSLSTWVGGVNGGTFVGNFPMTNSMAGQFVTVKKNGTVYFSDVDQNSFKGLLWTVACPAGACGTQTQVAGVSFESPGGMVFDNTGDLFVIDDSAITANTFELPNPAPSTCPLSGAPVSVAVDRKNHTFVTTDDERFGILEGKEYSLPGCVLVGRVGGTNSQGIAIDP